MVPLSSQLVRPGLIGYWKHDTYHSSVPSVFTKYHNPELYYFFVAIAVSSLTALILVIFNFKASLHQMGIAGVTMFLILLR